MAISTTPVGAAAVLGARAALLDSYQRESATTLKILRAYPPALAELRPHPTSNSAQQLAWTFVIENALMEAALRNELRMPPAFSPMPPEWNACVELYEKGVKSVTALLQSVRDEELNGDGPVHDRPTSIRRCLEALPLYADAERLDPPPRPALGVPADKRRKGSIDLRALTGRAMDVVGPAGRQLSAISHQPSASAIS